MVAARARRDAGVMNENTTHIPEIRRLERSRSDRMLAGVSGGLASYFEIHPAVFRVGFVVLTLLGGAGILIYAAAAIVMPDEGKEDSIATAALRNRRDRPWPLIGLGLLAVAGVALLSRATLWPHGDAWILFLIAGAVILWVTRHTPTAAATDEAGAPAKRARPMVRALTIIGVVLASLTALVVLAAAAFVAIFDVHLGRGIGDRSYVVTSVQDLRTDYRLGIGSLKLDLGSLQVPKGETHVTTSVDVGELDVTVPADVSLRIHGSAEVGEVALPDGLGADGRNVAIDLTENGDRVLVLDAHVGAGEVRVERAVR
jgi:phage shock protein PspC (stress-responsive transcriptional regulator)